MKLMGDFSLFFAIVLAESCSPNHRGCCYFDFTNPANNHKLSVNCHCDGQWCSTNFGEATPGAVTVTCPNAGEPYDFSWRYRNGNLAAVAMSPIQSVPPSTASVPVRRYIPFKFSRVIHEVNCTEMPCAKYNENG
ncbi:hypothetical protein GE09DRAFT_1063486 [Coniochaeta sp. 2T2.1]|nr:hypothetical protein GE09DRAFT_1063486 [Coniochaeta sp. 2T2.1]